MFLSITLNRLCDRLEICVKLDGNSEIFFHSNTGEWNKGPEAFKNEEAQHGWSYSRGLLVLLRPT